MGAWVICESRFTGSRELCELWENVNLKSKFTGKSRDLGSHKLGSHKLGSLKLGSHKLGSRSLFVNILIFFLT